MVKNRGFTLIELLVVVTIIVILLALLTPALDKAIYQSELTVCAARVRGLASAATIYASENKRAYPTRQLRKAPWRPNKMWHANGSNPPYDERKLIRPFVPSIDKQFQCPLLTEMDIDVEDLNTRAAGEAGWASYQFWYGWQYSKVQGSTDVNGTAVGGSSVNEKGMFKLGDRFSWTENGKESRFDILANDYDFVSLPEDENFAIGSHPDKGPQVMVESIVNNEPVVGGLGVGGTPRSNFIWSRWAGPFRRGPIDMNFAHADNSVSRLTDVAAQRSATDTAPEERVVRVPEGNNDSWTYWRNHLPAAGR